MTLSWTAQLTWIGGGSALAMLAGWSFQRRTKNAGIVDVLWAACLGASAAFCALTGDGEETRRAIVGVAGAIWGFRLASHVLMDRVIGKPEDSRYAHMRHALRSRAHAVFLLFFLAQAVLVAILSVPFVLAARDASPGPSALDILGAVIWIAGLCGETIADRQLLRFKRDERNKGKVCDAGLWRFSRHPNYFFEWTMWVAYATIATPSHHGWIAWAAPAIMLVLVLKVTGIPPTEARSVQSRGEAYREYQRTTSAFVPWFSRRKREQAAGAAP